MKRSILLQIGLRAAFATMTMAVGTLFGGGCLGAIARNVNPCGSVIDCDPLEFDLLFGDFQLNDIDACPISIFPTECAGQFPPLEPVGPGATPTTGGGGLGGGGLGGGGLGGGLGGGGLGGGLIGT